MSYSIAEAARRSGLSIDTLRYYERINLLEPPARDAAGRRAYSDDDLDWLVFLTRLRATGMSIKLMREYAQLRRRSEANAPRLMGILVEQRDSVRARIAELQSCLDVLDYKIDRYDEVCRVQAATKMEEMSA
ncbi:MerR family transcriptional regulator [Amycolatopsis pithecellobii]|uniref:MerR family transcriptional regulator n=1 Tax=Amycolatopsis pithecellobii TaxID=664692 RepID=A0A6N7ZCE5_9PSEU|nr:MerR family transcriptional regulator [Amycolatopsis pithecellobii]MTD59349.1 MerR family transcriptional regulator [Amycolatopsis pithecellobii]